MLRLVTFILAGTLVALPAVHAMAEQAGNEPREAIIVTSGDDLQSLARSVNAGQRYVVQLDGRLGAQMAELCYEAPPESFVAKHAKGFMTNALFFAGAGALAYPIYLANRDSYYYNPAFDAPLSQQVAEGAARGAVIGVGYYASLGALHLLGHVLRLPGHMLSYAKAAYDKSKARSTSK